MRTLCAHPARLSAFSLCIAVLIGAAVPIAGCGSSPSSPAQSSRELTLERAQLEQVSKQLSALEQAVKREVAASRVAWPAIAGGLPQAPGKRLRATVKAANAGATALAEPLFLANASRLTGPASGIAGIYENYEQLSRRGWTMTEAAVQTIASAEQPAANGTSASPGAAAQASFERANSPLYIDIIYDGHFDLSLLGKSLASGYKKLGGAQAFGAALTQAQVNALADFYSIAAVRLEPHPSGAAKDG
ncbi:MAG TPA: hypothetical protein VIJ50_06245 [Solirubrobacteraceae bacterium]